MILLMARMILLMADMVSEMMRDNPQLGMEIQREKLNRDRESLEKEMMFHERHSEFKTPMAAPDYLPEHSKSNDQYNDPFPELK